MIAAASRARLERERAVLERSLEREEQRAAVLVERHEARRRDAEDELSDAEESNQDLRLRLAQLEGLIKGWAPLVLGGMPEPTKNEGSVDRKQALRGQAALARARKTNVSPEARLRLLEEAERLGVLPADLQRDLAALRTGR